MNPIETQTLNFKELADYEAGFALLYDTEIRPALPEIGAFRSSALPKIKTAYKDMMGYTVTALLISAAVGVVFGRPLN